ncbi:MAG TPA: carboxymuconolactone decarboxylase family protein [Candidatus Sulfotelmatobacter sp.]|nr:carboxymuconolactone decarboxylase family protein [Candidatus Sulfotelmatobacter sp.]
MSQRLNPMTAAPEAIQPLFAAGKYLTEGTLEPVLRTLVYLRVSQINACAFCIAMHNRELEHLGESGDRVWGLPAWREAPWYSPRERAALAYAETLTRLAEEDVGDELFAELRAQFSEREIVDLTLAISIINTWNRFSVSFRTPPESAAAVLASLRQPAMAGAGH